MDAKSASSPGELCHDKGQIIIAVTHDDDFAANNDRIIELQDGGVNRALRLLTLG